MFLFEKKKFYNFLSKHEIINKSVYGSEYSIRISEDEVHDNSYGIIIAKLLNEGKAIRKKNGYIYVDPYYNHYKKSIWSISPKKLLKKVKKKNFKVLINQAEIVVEKDENKNEEKSFFYKIAQKDIRRFSSIMTIAELINEDLAYVKDNGKQDIYLKLEYLSVLEKEEGFNNDLFYFRSMIGESHNLRKIITMIEQSDYKNKKICIKKKTISELELSTEIYSLCDLGVIEEKNGDFWMEPEFASWLLFCIEEISDRISYVNMYEE